MSSCSFYIFLFVSNRKQRRKQEYTQTIYTGIGLETIPTQVTEDSKLNLKHHQVISWKISFPLLHYRFSWFKWCHHRGTATGDLFSSWMPGATQASSPAGVLSCNWHWEQTDLISTHIRNSCHKTQCKFSPLLAGQQRRQGAESAPCGTMPCHCLTPSTDSGYEFQRTVNLAPLGSIQFKAKILIKQLILVWQYQS